MAKPRTFVSSTCLDLADARAAVKQHLELLGHEPLLSDSLTFGVTPKRHSHQACLDQVDNADYFVLIIGGRRGGTFVGSEKSITNEEYRRAMKRGLPVLVFVSESVEQAGRIYRRNPKADLSEFVDDVRVFDFIDMVRTESEDNWIRKYKDVEDIKRAITSQFAYIALLYSKNVISERSPRRKNGDQEISVIALPREFSSLVKSESSTDAFALISGLKRVHSTISAITKSSVSGKDEKLLVIWLFGRYGRLTYSGSCLRFNVDRFRQYAWGMTRSKRVFTQLSDFGVFIDFNDGADEEGNAYYEMNFSNDDEGDVLAALQRYVEDLLKKHDEDGALELFKRADMKIYA